MKRFLATAALSLGLALSTLASAWATPSTQIWIPSTDIQATGTFHLGIDNYVTVAPAAGAPTSLYVAGLTYGAFSGLEVGFDYMTGLTSPVMFNAKYGMAESASLPVSFAVGAYNVGFDTAANNDQNIIYGLIAKNFDPIGRLSVGYYTSNERIFGAGNNTGILASWDKALTDKVWAAVDYQGGNNALGALSFGLSYAFSSNTSVILGYDIYNVAGVPGTVTTQLDINF